MKVSELEYTIKDMIPKLMDDHMRGYILDCLKSSHILRHNTQKDTPYYITALHERNDMVKGNELYIEYIGELMEERFGHNFRTTSVYSTLSGDSQYGHQYAMIPFGGEYEICYSPDVHDMYYNYHEVKMKVYDEMYNLIKNGWESDVLPENILSIWNGMEHTVQHMKNSLDHYASYLSSKGVDQASVKMLLSKFKEMLNHFYHILLKTYKVSGNITSVVKDVGHHYNPAIELMVKSPKYLMINEKYILDKYNMSVLEFLDYMV